MDEFKKDILKKENVSFHYDSLNEQQVLELLYQLADKYDIAFHIINSSSIFNCMYSILKNEYIVNVNDENGFYLIRTSLKLSINDDDDVFIIWNYNDIDKIKVYILQRYWDYIWYGAADEMCIICDPKNNSLFMITDYGTVYGNADNGC